MNIKDLFKQAENGTLTYEQFEAFSKEHKAKLVDLSEGNSYIRFNIFSSMIVFKPLAPVLLSCAFKQCWFFDYKHRS